MILKRIRVNQKIIKEVKSCNVTCIFKSILKQISHKTKHGLIKASGIVNSEIKITTKRFREEHRNRISRFFEGRKK